MRVPVEQRGDELPIERLGAESVENRFDSARNAVELKRRQVTNAVDAGRAAAQQARVELEQRIAETKAAYKES